MNEEKKFNTCYMKSVGKGVMLAFLFSLVFLFCLSIILSTTSVSENIIVPAIITITAISILASSSIVTLKIDQKGIICGGAIGILYMLILYLLSSIANLTFSVGISTLIMLVAAVICGCIGGIVGVNMNIK